VNHRIEAARTPEDIAMVRDLIHEYVRSLGIDIALKGFEAELPQFPGDYAPPAGGLLLARGEAGEALGCICLRALEIPGACEVKRLYVRDAARGTGVGRALVTSVLDLAVARSYREAMLDTLPWMTAAMSIYRAAGFGPVEPYWDNAVPGILYFGKTLRSD
jgi:GNAT superfamily N-acetyltransferase